MSDYLDKFDFFEVTSTFLDHLRESVTTFEGDIVLEIQSTDNSKMQDIKQIHRKDILQHLAKTWSLGGDGLFSFPLVLPEVYENINLDVQDNEDDGKEYLFINLAQLLSLPNKQPDVEILELKDFLEHFKNKSIELELFSDAYITTSRGFGPTSLKFQTKDNKFPELSQEFQSRIESSETLTHWSNAIKRGIEHTDTHCENLFYNFNIIQLFTFEELEIMNEHTKRHCKKLKR